MADDPRTGAGTTAEDARRWLATMPASVAGQRQLLESLVVVAERGPAFRWLELGGSLARGFLWQLWAVSVSAVYPAFGLTAVLDTPGATPPPGIDATAAGLDPADIRRAAIALAALLVPVTKRAQFVIPFEGPDGLQAWARARLSSQES